MKIKTSELTGDALDWAVATALGYTPSTIQGIDWGKRWEKPAPIGFWDEVDSPDGMFRPSESWTQGGPIIEREKMRLVYRDLGRDSYWCAEAFEAYAGNRYLDGKGPAPLIAAMRCLCRAKLGDEVEIPDEVHHE